MEERAAIVDNYTMAAFTAVADTIVFCVILA
jgi:hypothetical protein